MSTEEEKQKMGVDQKVEPGFAVAIGVGAILALLIIIASIASQI